MRNLVKISVVLAAFLFIGCVNTANMPLSEGVTAVDTSTKSLLIGRVHIKNENKPNHHPELSFVFVKKGEEETGYRAPALISEAGDKGKDYFVSLDVAPGPMTLKRIWFRRSVFPINASANLSVEQNLNIPAGKVVYIGNIDAVIKKRTSEDQIRAGSVIPLIDQAVAGFSDGTFEVKVTDNYEEDVKLLRSKYPFLKDKEIVKVLLKDI